MPAPLQELIHKYEVGSGYRFLTYALALLAMLAVAVCYDLAAFRNLSNADGMDTAQLARNLSEGKGFTTKFIRPFGIYLLRKHAAEQRADLPGGAPAAAPNPGLGADHESARLNGTHPDLANPPVYPLLLAGALKLMPFGYPDLAQAKNFRIYLPDLWIALVNQVLLLAAVVMVFLLARKLFDPAVGWVAAAALLGAELFWRFSLAGLSTTLLLVIVLALFRVLAGLEPAAREGTRSQAWLLAMAALAGVLVGVGGLTRYAFGCLIIPVALFLATLPGPNRTRLMLLAMAAFLLVMTPWVVRNYSLSGTPFGTAGFAVFQGTPLFPGQELERMLHPDFSQITSTDFWNKFLTNGRDILQNDLPKLGGSWVSALFLAGLLVPFRSAKLSRLRWFLVGSLAVLSLAQALGRTGATADSPEVNSENLVIVLAPLVFIYGVSLFFNLLEQFIVLPVRNMVIGIFCLLASLPLLLTLISPHPSPVAYPPYYPPFVQEKARWIEENEWMAADIPWAVAWYGHRQSVWLPLKYTGQEPAKETFYELNRFKPLNGLYLTAKTLKTLDLHSIAQWRQAEGEDKDWPKYQALIKVVGQQLVRNETSGQNLDSLRDSYSLAEKHWNLVPGKGDDWESFVLGVFINQEVPTGFPLRSAPEMLQPEIFLTDSERVAKKAVKPPKAVQEP